LAIVSTEWPLSPTPGPSAEISGADGRIRVYPDPRQVPRQNLEQPVHGGARLSQFRFTALGVACRPSGVSSTSCARWCPEFVEYSIRPSRSSKSGTRCQSSIAAATSPAPDLFVKDVRDFYRSLR
jgi:hypothetical protein